MLQPKATAETMKSYKLEVTFKKIVRNDFEDSQGY